MNSSVEPSELANKVFAGIKGGILPDGIKEENVIYFDSREESLNAVESGLADYGYGNTFSVAYYSLLNGYKNIITIPRGIEPREYGIAIKSDDLILVSILNKSIDLIDPNQLHAVILEASTKIDRKITFSMIMDEYWIEISISVGLVFSIILISFLYNLRTNKQLKLQNKKYEALAHISNEFFYQYDFTSDNFQVSYQGRELFNSESDLYKAISILKEALKNLDAENCNMNIRVPLENGEVKVLRSINYCVMDERKHIVSIIGKLSDISKEEAEKEDLLFKAQIDGLTCLYNAETTRKLISERLDFVGDGEQDAFILIDCDDFKEINDSYGHLTGNTVLKKLAEVLKAAFRKADIIGRIGGDDFCVYMMKIPSVDFVKQRFEGLDTPFVTVSTGIVLINEQCSFEEMFKKADEALYQAKGSGKGKVVIYEEKKGNRL
ncbi:MAG: GGDEF domain-containing protein [Firmicutes bacterium]|nr:GGDEF domain-containing protein [Bacillota bacterium]